MKSLETPKLKSYTKYTAVTTNSTLTSTADNCLAMTLNLAVMQMKALSASREAMIVFCYRDIPAQKVLSAWLYKLELRLPKNNLK